MCSEGRRAVVQAGSARMQAFRGSHTLGGGPCREGSDTAIVSKTKASAPLFHRDAEG